jgi:hypothetical protein
MATTVLSENAPGTRNWDAELTRIFVAVRKCFLLLNEGVTAISVFGCVAVRLFFASGEGNWEN